MSIAVISIKLKEDENIFKFFFKYEN